ncbi:MAG: nitrile hydratase subunit beta [Chloroflexia bacterium]
MNGVHDLGGMHGFGKIEREENEPVFHAEWEGRVLGMQQNVRKFLNVDAFRHGIERMPPADYLRSSYYERWLASIERNLIDLGLIDGDEMEARVALLREHPDAVSPSAGDAPDLSQLLKAPPASPPPPAPRFAAGDAVVAKNVHPVGHTRLPRYARGKRGVIHRAYSAQTFPDANAHGLGEQPQMLYSVRFEGRELWGAQAEPGQVLYLDLWDSYLDPA